MSVHDAADIIVAIAALATCWISWLSRRDIKVVKHATNSLTDRLVATTRSDAHQAGVEEGRRQ